MNYKDILAYPQTNLGRICNEPNEVYVPFLDDTRNAVVK